MSADENFLTQLQSRLAGAQERFKATGEALKIAQPEYQAAVQRFQQLQVQHNQATQELNSLQVLIGSEMQKQSTAPGQPGPPTRLIINLRPGSPGQVQPPNEPQGVSIPGADGNKTEIIREVLRSHPGGLTPAELWKYVKPQIPQRSYVYSVLQRLKDRGQIQRMRKGKYSLKIVTKAEEERAGQTFVH
jgi:hypothetical protein